MNPETAQLAANVINVAFSILAARIRQAEASASIAERFGLADAMDQPVTAADVTAALGYWQDEIDRGRRMSDGSPPGP